MNPQNPQFNIDAFSSSVFKPLCVGVGELNELKDNIHKEQFFDYDETVYAEKVLDENKKQNFIIVRRFIKY